MKTISPAGTPGYDGVTQPAELGSRQNREKCGSTDKGLKGPEVNDLIKAVHSFIEGIEWRLRHLTPKVLPKVLELSQSNVPNPGF